MLWAERGGGAEAERIDRFSGRRTPLRLRPSRASSLAHGFAKVSRFFPGAREVLAAIDDDVCRRVLGPVRLGKAQCFEDQYLSSAGQLHELIVGHDRFVADLRPLVKETLRRRGVELGICAHPYDLCTDLLAREAGVIGCTPEGRPLDARLALEPNVAWVGYANEAIRRLVEPALQGALRDREVELGLCSGSGG